MTGVDDVNDSYTVLLWWVITNRWGTNSLPFLFKGQFIGKVDPGSAAEAAGLRLGDRIIEVNGHNVTEESHREVVQRIKSVPNETKLLVIDPSGQLYFAERKIVITPSIPNLQKMRTPDTPPTARQQNNRPTQLPLEEEKSRNNTNGAPPTLSALQVSIVIYHFFLEWIVIPKLGHTNHFHADNYGKFWFTRTNAQQFKTNLEKKRSKNR